MIDSDDFGEEEKRNRNSGIRKIILIVTLGKNLIGVIKIIFCDFERLQSQDNKS